MNITDKEVLKELKRVKSVDLEDDVFDYPENERDGKSDMQFFTDEVSYIVSCYEEYGNAKCESLEEAKEIIRRTKNGKVIPLWESTLKPVYRQSDITSARDTINEYKRLKNCLKRLNSKGIYGYWQ